MIGIMLSILRILNILNTMFNPNRIWMLYGGIEAMKLLALGLLRYGKGLLCWYRVRFESQFVWSFVLLSLSCSLFLGD